MRLVCHRFGFSQLVLNLAKLVAQEVEKGARVGGPASQPGLLFSRSRFS